MGSDGRQGQRRTGSSRMTALIEIEGPEGRVLEEGSRLLRMVVDDPEGATVHERAAGDDRANPPSHVVGPGTDVLELVTAGCASPEEATLWRLVLHAPSRSAPFKIAHEPE